VLGPVGWRGSASPAPRSASSRSCRPVPPRSTARSPPALRLAPLAGAGLRSACRGSRASRSRAQARWCHRTRSRLRLLALLLGQVLSLLPALGARFVRGCRPRARCSPAGAWVPALADVCPVLLRCCWHLPAAGALSTRGSVCWEPHPSVPGCRGVLRPHRAGPSSVLDAWLAAVGLPGSGPLHSDSTLEPRWDGGRSRPTLQAERPLAAQPLRPQTLGGRTDAGQGWGALSRSRLRLLFRFGAPPRASVGTGQQWKVPWLAECLPAQLLFSLSWLFVNLSQMFIAVIFVTGV